MVRMSLSFNKTLIILVMLSLVSILGCSKMKKETDIDIINEALKQRNARGHEAEITFIGVNSAKIKEHKKIGKILNVTVEFIAEVITCIKDKDKKIVSGDPEKIKKVYDTWKFSRNVESFSPNWLLIDIKA